MVPPVLVAGGLGAAVLALRLRDPHVQGSWGGCPLAAVGIDCPGCGGLRAVNDLAHARVLEAASSNLLLVAAVPVVVWLLLRWSASRWTGRHWQLSQRWQYGAAVALGALVVVFTVLRNTPAGAWLAP
ncbi:DUF2752 domain-containing protein [Nocardioides sp. zg-536]|uniref:DUF2752 domain-containing protein n=2 Tax=Nocardioides faecalis TaxID=2803858 RepID=A0A938Y287_9ACTN|nr:DUF2752 domain-containing protein [Nocardioides faecalis]MBS4754421.1 DUF2752 domain-containing protein [Nocardioides faecalis]QVI60605.1 DUF2752 domain-containing protein [Nocardioides faecalis]